MVQSNTTGEAAEEDFGDEGDIHEENLHSNVHPIIEGDLDQMTPFDRNDLQQIIPRRVWEEEQILLNDQARCQNNQNSVHEIVVQPGRI